MAPIPQKRPREEDVEPLISTPVKPTTMHSAASTPLSVLSVRTPSPSPHKSSAPTLSNVPSFQTVSAPAGSQPAKRRKLTSQEKDAQRIEKEAKNKVREEKKAQKEAEDKIKADQKAQKEEDKRKKNEEREERKRLKEEEQQRLEDEKAKKARVSRLSKIGSGCLRTALWSLLVTA